MRKISESREQSEVKPQQISRDGYRGVARIAERFEGALLRTRASSRGNMVSPAGTLGSLRRRACESTKGSRLEMEYRSSRDRIAIESRSSRDPHSRSSYPRFRCARVQHRSRCPSCSIQLARSVAHRPLHIAVSQMHRHFLTARPERGALRGVERSGSRNVNRTSSILLHPRLTGPWDVS